MTGAKAATPEPHSRALAPATIAGMFVWLAALLLYTLTAGPGIVELFDDSLEFQLVAPTLGIAHPTGYPLYALAGGVWSRLLFPFGNWAWRMNIFSALAAATAVLFVYLTAARLLPRAHGRLDIWAGLAAAGAFALGPVWWSQATIAEVYALHGLLMAAILYTTISVPPLFLKAQAAGTQQVTSRRMTLLGFLLGLSLAHHRTTLLLAPGIVVYLLWSVPGLWRPRKEWLLWLGAFLLPLTLYLYLPIRAGQGVSDLNGSYVNTSAGFMDHVLARSYTGFFTDNSLGDPHTAADVLRLVWRQLGLAASVLTVTGLLAMPFRSSAARKNWSLIALVLATNLGFASLYQVADWEVFLIPVFLTLSLFAGAGVTLVTDWFAGSPALGHTWHRSRRQR